MTLQEMIKSLDNLSTKEQAYLFDILRLPLAKQEEKTRDNQEETFGKMTLKYREKMEVEGIEFTDEDFANLRDKSTGREVRL